MAIKNLIQLRKGSSSEWSNVNPVLASGEPGYDFTNNIIKVGDGVTSWNNLSSISASSSGSGSVDLDTTLVAGTGINFSYDSVNNTLTILASGLQPSGNYSTVGHSHLSSDITNFNSGVSGLLPSVSGSEYVVVSLANNNYTISTTGLQPSGSYANSSHSHNSSDITNFNTSVSGLISGIYAPLNSPTLTGIPLAPTANSGTNTNQIASTAFVRTEISNLVASAPATLDTLNELASALGNDPNFATTVTNNLTGKANLSGAIFTGSITAPTGNFTGNLQVNGTDVSLVGHTHTASAISDSTTAGRSLLTAADAAAQRTSLGLGSIATEPSGNYALATHASSHGANGSDPLTLNANQIATGTLSDARLSANVPILPGMLLYDHTPSACIETMPRYMTFFGTAGFTSGTIHYTFFTPLVTLTVSSITMHTVSTAASGLTMARMGLFTFNETTATLVARTANDTTLFTATRTGYTRNLDTSGGFPATYTLQAGTRYAVGVICVGTTMPTLSAISCLSEIYSRNPRMGGSMTNQSDLSTINVTGNTGLTIYARLA